MILWPEKAELRTEIFDFIEIFYDRRRRHSTLEMLSPVDYEPPSVPNQPLSTETGEVQVWVVSTAGVL